MLKGKYKKEKERVRERKKIKKRETERKKERKKARNKERRKGIQILVVTLCPALFSYFVRQKGYFHHFH